MSSAWLIRYEWFALEKNPIPTLKKKCSDLNNRAFAGVLLLITSRNRFAGRKNSHNTNAVRFLPFWTNSRERWRPKRKPTWSIS
jgi:hypothetical protein